MTNANRDDKELAKAMRRLLNADYLKTHIKEPLEEGMAPLLTGEEIDFSACTDSIFLSIFTHIDLLGYLYKGASFPRNAVQFLRDYLGRVDNRYEKVGGLLYNAFRHGYVHLATPKRIQLKDGKILDFSFNGSKQRENYLKVTKIPEIQRTGAKVDIYRLSLNLQLLYEDLLSAIDLYAEDICSNQGLSDTFWKAFETRRQPEKEEQILKGKKYIKDSDFTFVRKQISKL